MPVPVRSWPARASRASGKPGRPLPDVPVQDEPVQNAEQDVGSAKRHTKSVAKSQTTGEVGSEVPTAAERSPEAGVKDTEFSPSRPRYADGPPAPATVLSFSRLKGLPRRTEPRWPHYAETAPALRTNITPRGYGNLLRDNPARRPQVVTGGRSPYDRRGSRLSAIS